MKAIADRFNKMSASAKGLSLVVVAYVVTIGVVVFIIAFTIMMLIGETHCSTMSQALVALWIIIAVVFLTSVVLVGVVARKIDPSFSIRFAIVALHGVALLVSYVVLACGLMVAFNC